MEQAYNAVPDFKSHHYALIDAPTRGFNKSCKVANQFEKQVSRSFTLRVTKRGKEWIAEIAFCAEFDIPKWVIASAIGKNRADASRNALDIAIRKYFRGDYAHCE